MATHSDVLSDLAALRAQLREHRPEHQALLRLNPVRPIVDSLVDCLVVLAAVALIDRWGLAWSPVAVCLLGNRQRALGNILHDAGHRNLCRHHWCNDLIARGFVAPLLFASLSFYRVTHFRHHQLLGQPGADPDFLVPPETKPVRWISRYLACAGSGSAWWGSLVGHLGHSDAGAASRLSIAVWWVLVLGLMAWTTGATYTAHFVGLWLLARATTFHLITTFREMCDHHGLLPGGVFSFTRDVVCHGVLRACIHPRNNGYHLTHHLLPAIPYYRLPQAHRVLNQLPIYQARGKVCDAYFTGPCAVVRAWRTEVVR